MSPQTLEWVESIFSNAATHPLLQLSLSPFFRGLRDFKRCCLAQALQLQGVRFRVDSHNGDYIRMVRMDRDLLLVYHAIGIARVVLHGSRLHLVEWSNAQLLLHGRTQKLAGDEAWAWMRVAPHLDRLVTVPTWLPTSNRPSVPRLQKKNFGQAVVWRKVRVRLCRPHLGQDSAHALRISLAIAFSLFAIDVRLCPGENVLVHVCKHTLINELVGSQENKTHRYRRSVGLSPMNSFACANTCCWAVLTFCRWVHPKLRQSVSRLPPLTKKELSYAREREREMKLKEKWRVLDSRRSAYNGTITLSTTIN